MREDVKDLKELVKVQGKVTHGEVFTKTSVEAVAKKLARDFGMRGEKTELVKMLNEYYSSIASSASDNNLNFTNVIEKALPIAQYSRGDDYLQRKDYIRDREFDGDRLSELERLMREATSGREREALRITMGMLNK